MLNIIASYPYYLIYNKTNTCYTYSQLSLQKLMYVKAITNITINKNSINIIYSAEFYYLLQYYYTILIYAYWDLFMNHYHTIQNFYSIKHLKRNKKYSNIIFLLFNYAIVMPFHLS